MVSRAVRTQGRDTDHLGEPRIPSPTADPRGPSLQQSSVTSQVLCPSSHGCQTPPPHCWEGHATFISLLIVLPALDVVILGKDRGMGRKEGPNHISGLRLNCRERDERGLGHYFHMITPLAHPDAAQSFPTLNTLEPLPVSPTPLSSHMGAGRGREKSRDEAWVILTSTSWRQDATESTGNEQGRERERRDFTVRPTLRP